ncbi:ABC transporter ATP-binding protein [Falsochrobactrum shanghaiense]|uniref:ABC transporter ATP-binding protein n=1 Tax=Falsochrobactrum shanghaiense TaxID=2201899 RepID=A0A316J6B6_9HYPH|nr:ATP-binding cassette domain-containing protein [Falsochrobactrum shanghaiense]PWL16305.1 ABC transporter ATP-binding protein [Falsochrobactrum shanghaiense]
MQAVLEVTNLHGGYGRIPVLWGSTLSVSKGEVVGLIGHNGMGKTTLLKSIVGLLPTKSGTLTLDGQDVTSLNSFSRARRGIGYVPQGREIFPSLTVRENITVGGLAHKRNADDLIAAAVADFPQLERLLDRKGGALSGGEQQLLALARAMAGNPKVLLLDEPTEGIQPSIVSEIEDFLRKVAKEKDLSILVVEQDIEFIASVTHRAVLFSKGKAVKDVRSSDLNHSSKLDDFF